MLVDFAGEIVWGSEHGEGFFVGGDVGAHGEEGGVEDGRGVVQREVGRQGESGSGDEEEGDTPTEA